MSYADLLRDPRWQRKRLEVMQRADFACELCLDNTTTLNVHHARYVQGRKPWEYDMADLVCLCAPCHEREHDIESFAEKRERQRKQAQRDARLAAMSPEQRALVARMAEIDRELPLATSDGKDELTREKMALNEELRQRFPRTVWKEYR